MAPLLRLTGAMSGLHVLPWASQGHLRALEETGQLGKEHLLYPVS